MDQPAARIFVSCRDDHSSHRLGTRLARIVGDRAGGVKRFGGTGVISLRRAAKRGITALSAQDWRKIPGSAVRWP